MYTGPYFDFADELGFVDGHRDYGFTALAKLREHVQKGLRGGQSEYGNPALGPSPPSNYMAPWDAYMQLWLCWLFWLVFALNNSLQPTPRPLCGLTSWPLLGACSMYPGEQIVT